MTGPADSSMGWPDPEADVAAAAARSESDVVVSQLAQAEWAQIALADRLCGSMGRQLTVVALDGSRHEGKLVEVGDDWLLLASGDTDTMLVLSAVTTVSGVGDPAVSSDGMRVSFPSVNSLWREWCRARRHTRIALADGSVLAGRVVRVGRDTLDVVLHSRDRAATSSDERVVVVAASVVWTSSPR
jgi:hypothetical protein